MLMRTLQNLASFEPQLQCKRRSITSDASSALDTDGQTVSCASSNAHSMPNAGNMQRE